MKNVVENLSKRGNFSSCEGAIEGVVEEEWG